MQIVETEAQTYVRALRVLESLDSRVLEKETFGRHKDAAGRLLCAFGRHKRHYLGFYCLRRGCRA